MAQVTEIAERVGAPEGIEIVDVQLRGSGKSRLLRIFIDRPEGVRHADCEFISQNVGTILDVEDVIPGGSYTLEVSSPGVERPLVKPRDYERFVGSKVRIVLREAVEGSTDWVGTLSGVKEGKVSLTSAGGQQVTFGLDRVKRANLKFDW